MSIELNKIKQASSRQKTSTSLADRIIKVLNTDIKFGKGGLNDKLKESFYNELSILLSSGIDIKTTLDIVAESQKKKEPKQLFNALKEKILNGMSLSEALESSGRFSAYEFYSIRIGEESGNLPKVLTDLQQYFSKRVKQRRNIINALTYPVMVLVIAILAVTFMLNYIVPMFTEVFDRFGGELPGITQFILKLSDAFNQNVGLLVPVILVIVVMRIAFRKKEWYRRMSASLLLHTPILGNFMKNIYVARYFQAMTLLTGAKTPLLRATQLVKQMITFYPFQRALTNLEEGILQGRSLYECLDESKLFETKQIYLVKVGEEVNELEKIFGQLNQQITDELEHKTQLLSSMLEPVMIIFVGLLVAVILISMYLPLFQLSGSIY